jgi:hypothetical protein
MKSQVLALLLITGFSGSANAQVAGPPCCQNETKGSSVSALTSSSTPIILSCLINGDRINNSPNLYVYLDDKAAKAGVGSLATIASVKWNNAHTALYGTTWTTKGRNGSLVSYRLDRVTGGFTTKNSNGAQQSFVCKANRVEGGIVRAPTE